MDSSVWVAIITVCGSILVAPQYVITTLMNFHDEVKFSNKNKSIERHDQLLKELLIAVRKDIGLSTKDNVNTI